MSEEEFGNPAMPSMIDAMTDHEPYSLINSKLWGTGDTIPQPYPASTSNSSDSSAAGHISGGHGLFITKSAGCNPVGTADTRGTSDPLSTFTEDSAAAKEVDFWNINRQQQHKEQQTQQQEQARGSERQRVQFDESARRQHEQTEQQLLQPNLRRKSNPPALPDSTSLQHPALQPLKLRPPKA